MEANPFLHHAAALQSLLDLVVRAYLRRGQDNAPEGRGAHSAVQAPESSANGSGDFGRRGKTGGQDLGCGGSGAMRQRAFVPHSTEGSEGVAVGNSGGVVPLHADFDKIARVGKGPRGST